MEHDAMHPPTPEPTRREPSEHHGEKCPFVRLMTPEVVAQIEAAIALVREAGRHDISGPLDAWLVRITRVSAAISEEGQCGPELYIG